jgi:hypothetical protein
LSCHHRQLSFLTTETTTVTLRIVWDEFSFVGRSSSEVLSCIERDLLHHSVNAERRLCEHFKEPGVFSLCEDLPLFEEQLLLLDKFDFIPDDNNAGSGENSWRSSLDQI